MVNAHRCAEAKAARRRKRLSTESRWHANRRQRRLAATVNRGSAIMLLSIQPGPRAKPKLDERELVPVVCSCDPLVAHGPHWVMRGQVNGRRTILDWLRTKVAA